MISIRFCLLFNILVIANVLEVSGKLFVIKIGRHRNRNVEDILVKKISLPDKKSTTSDLNVVLDSIQHRRHHIAHFCPSLDLARECIRTCMSDGLAAFCGKDHVCYCGHKYSEHDRPPTSEEKSYYKDFKDMYIKYLGMSPDGSIPDGM